MALKTSSVLVADEDLYLDREGKLLLADGDARASSLLARKGQPIPQKIADRLKLSKESKPELLQKVDLKAKINFGGKQAKTLAPEQIEKRETRPESPQRTR